MALLPPVAADNLALKLRPGASAKYSVGVTQMDFGADTRKPSSTLASRLPILISVISGRTVSVVSGPLVIHDRPVGRSRTQTRSLDAWGLYAGHPPAPFFVGLPPSGAKVGQSWQCEIFGGPPLPAGMKASYVFRKAKGPFAEVDFNVNARSAGRVVGSGQLFLRLSDGIIDHGSARFEITFLRPSPKDHKTLVRNNSVRLEYKITNP